MPNEEWEDTIIFRSGAKLSHHCPDCDRECDCEEPEGICLCECDQAAYERERDRLEALREGDR